MRLPTSSSSVSEWGKGNRSGSRVRKKHKRLDAISEEAYNQSRGEADAGDGVDSELRRSSRVRRVPEILDASPPPPRKRQRVNRNVGSAVGSAAGGGGRSKESGPQNVDDENVEYEGGWRSRLRVRGRNAGAKVKASPSEKGKRKLFREVGEIKREKMVLGCELDDGKKGRGRGVELGALKSKRLGMNKASNGLEGASRGVLEDSDSVSDDSEDSEKATDSSEGSEQALDGSENGEKALSGSEDSEQDSDGSEDGKKASSGSEDREKALSGSEEDEDKGVVFYEVEDNNGVSESDGMGNGVEEAVETLEGEIEEDEDKGVVFFEVEDHNEVSKSDGMGNGVEEAVETLEGEIEKKTVDGNATEVDEKGERETSAGLQLDEGCIGIDNGDVAPMELNDNPLEESECVKEGEHKGDTVEAFEILTSHAEDRGNPDEKTHLVRLAGEPAKDESTVNANCSTRDRLGKPRIKEGRRCGLCGGGTDGKPPKKLAHSAGDSENETYSTSSASEGPNYDIWDGFGDESGWLGRLLGPINDRYGIAGIWVHQHCAVWSPEVYFAGLGCLKNVRAALCRGKALKCTRCGRPGATIGCRVDRCPRTYHLPCARANGCIFDHRKFLIACTDHRKLFQPHGNQHLFQIKKIKTKKMKLQLRKLSNDALRKDIEAEEKWLENCGEDEEFLKRESKRLHRDLLRIAPVYIGGPNSESGKLFQGWESVAGLQNVIQCMKEVVILPLLYPEFFGNLGLTPPRGVLLHGYPGTGKTLVVRALIGSCARGDRRIAYFARKGADCLGKYVGDAERQLRLLFQVAEKCQPSIIFFDEIDGLAPCRTRQQDQTHSSVVSTLLALLDGLKSRGSVVVIGATNRPEAVDPALRRPGRFDREIYFPLPSVQDRAEILSLHTKKWPKPVSGSLLKWVANKTVGFAGADLQALCTQAAMIALKRNFPLHETLSAAEEKAPHKRLSLPAFTVEERDWLEALSHVPPPCSRREAGMAVNDVVSSPLPSHLIPCLLQPLTVLLVSLSIDEHLWLPPPISKAATAIKDVIVSALGKKKLPIHQWWSFVSDFLQDEEVAKEIEHKLLYAGILLGDSSSNGVDASDGDNDDDTVKLDTLLRGGARPSLLQNLSSASREKAGFQILISGSPKSGQRHLASCLLHCYAGNVEIHKVDMATASQEGHGDVVQGLAYILTKCASVGPCLVFMPRIDLWAVEAHPHGTEERYSSPIVESQVDKENDSCLLQAADMMETQGAYQVAEEGESCTQQCESAEMTEAEDVSLSVSHEWSLFVDQLGSLRVSSPLMILATSDVPFTLLPEKIRQFFKGDILNCSRSMSMEHTILRFSIQVDGNFKHDRVVNLSVAELSRELIQQYVQLTHQKKHTNISSHKKYKLCDSLEGTTEPATKVHQSIDHVSANGDKEQIGGPDGTTSKGLPHRNRIMKGKSNLMLALSTFGYQILCYPHFAELCWVTSKLKEGPCVDISGPWKGWPFNSCIVRPINLPEKVVVASNSSNIKSKDNSGLVRGLIAVGLSAYRGIYISPREVSFEVRKVLELLVGQINVKVQAGKDRYQYVRLLSQVAYLEDVVNSWAHALQSLEPDAQMIQENPKQVTGVSSHNDNTSVDNQVQNLECESIVGGQSSHELKPSEDTSQQVVVENCESNDLSKRNGDVDDPNIVRRYTITIPEDGFQQKCSLLDDSVSVEDLDGSRGMDQVVGETLHEKNTTTFRPADSDTVNCAMSHEDSGLLRQSYGSAFTESTNVDPNTFSRKETSPCADNELVCIYQCCSECLHMVNILMQKIIAHELGLGNCRTVEDVHDVVSLLSVDLLSTVRKVHVAENPSTLFDRSTKRVNYKKFEHLGLRDCQCKDFGGRILPMECSCHSTGGSANATASTTPNAQTGLRSQFIFRDGVLGPLDVDKDVSFHCKFETLCLCSLIESIVMTKQPCR